MVRKIQRKRCWRSGQNERLAGIPLSELIAGHPSLRLICFAASISWKYYAPWAGTGGYQWSAFDAIEHIRNGAEWRSNVVPYTQFVADASDTTNCKLPVVSWLVPDARDSEHPTTPMSQGQNWTTAQINAVMKGACWSSTAIF
jgi:phospholipase C